MKERRLAGAIFVVVLGTYGYFFNGGGWNQNANFALTRAMVERSTFSIDEYQVTGDVSTHGGHTYINKAPGLSLFAAVPYTLLYLIESNAGVDLDGFIATTINAFICTVIVCGVSGALVGVVLFWILRSAGRSAQSAALIALMVSFGTPLFAYSTAFFAHVPSAALILLSFCFAIRRKSRYDTFLAGMFIGFAALTNYLCLPVIAFFALLVARPTERFRGLVMFLAGTVPPLLLLGYYQQVTTGAFWRTPIETMTADMRSPGAVYGILRAPSLEAFLGITISPYRGLFFLSPLLLLALAGLFKLWRMPSRRLEALVISVTIAFFLMFNSMFNGWHGGDTIGPRYLVAVVPLFGVLLGYWNAGCQPAGAQAATLRATKLAAIQRPSWPGSTLLWLVLAAISIFLNFVVTAVDPLPPVEARNPVRSYVLPLLFTGRTATDAELPAKGSFRYRTGHTSTNLDSVAGIASKWSSFNLGELIFGPGNPWSLLPVLVWMTAGAAALSYRARRVA